MEDKKGKRQKERNFKKIVISHPHEVFESLGLFKGFVNIDVFIFIISVLENQV